MRGAGWRRPSGQTWATFLRNHAHETWACDFLQVTEVPFRPMFAFFLVELASRRVVHVGVTRHPADAWVTQQLREATPFDARPRFLIRDNDAKYGRRFDQLAEASGTPSCARRCGPARQRDHGAVPAERPGECLDHLLPLGERQLRLVLRENVAYFNQARPHQGLGQRVPVSSASTAPTRGGASDIIAVPVLGGLHHTYQRAA